MLNRAKSMLVTEEFICGFENEGRKEQDLQTFQILQKNEEINPLVA